MLSNFYSLILFYYFLFTTYNAIHTKNAPTNCCILTDVLSIKTDKITVKTGVKNKKLLAFNAPPRAKATYHKPKDPTDDGKANHKNQNHIEKSPYTEGGVFSSKTKSIANRTNEPTNICPPDNTKGGTLTRLFLAKIVADAQHNAEPSPNRLPFNSSASGLKPMSNETPKIPAIKPKTCLKLILSFNKIGLNAATQSGFVNNKTAAADAEIYSIERNKSPIVPAVCSKPMTATFVQSAFETSRQFCFVSQMMGKVAIAATKKRIPTSEKGGIVFSKILLAMNDEPIQNVAPTIAA